MPLPTTEIQTHGAAVDALTPHKAATAFLQGQQDALTSINAAIPAISDGARRMADAIRAGGTIIYAAAGSSGLMALADGCELPGTFGIAQSSVKIHMAGGVPADGTMPGDTEDDETAASEAARDIRAIDVVIVLSASGTTPYALTIAKGAKAAGATVIAIANNPDTPLLALADVSICLATPPEVITGSTRLGAGTAQKATLNMMSSMMGIHLGHVYQGMMVNVVADNAKLQERAKRIVALIANVSRETAQTALAKSNGNAKTAILIALGSTPDVAAKLLEQHAGHLKACIHSISSSQNVNV